MLSRSHTSAARAALLIIHAVSATTEVLPAPPAVAFEGKSFYAPAAEAEAPEVLAGGGLRLPGLGVVGSSFAGRAFGASAPAAGDEWQIAVDAPSQGVYVVSGNSSALGFEVRRTYTFGVAADAGADSWNPRPFARVAVEDRVSPRGGDGLLGLRVNHTLQLDPDAAAKVSDALLFGAFNGDARTALETSAARGTNGNPSVLLSLDDGRATGFMAFDSVLRAHAVLGRGIAKDSMYLSDPTLALARDDGSYVRRADLPLMNRGDAAAATWIFR